MSGNHIAGTTTDSFTPVEMLAGEAPLITKAFDYATGLNLAAKTVVALNSSNQMIQWVPGGAAPTNVAVGITCEAVNTAAGVAKHPTYVGGYFNTDALVWPGGVTAAQQLNAFLGTQINHRKIGYSG